ncbi:dihydrolipoyl dehydrogenase [Paludibacter jiangxiensis]|uniref:Dihydrolipoyl dehydrogenase n=1 Tax=Paludibacter jiangxiensis TaxID=681398 RepID=A0A161LWJ6_9BACT|nr:dihydrolipoyl dehydrogenase [Paludibacter jiangxiensis]GAT63552.1 dihydrolipoamide dehydrogenase [Paludibacter jiangxiensis]
MEYDIAIIGGGPAGYNAAERAATNGLKTVLFEKNAIGGVCLNEGCIPSKTLLYSAKLSDNAKGSSKYGINLEGTPSFALDKIIGRKNKVVKKLTAGVRMKLIAAGVSIIEGEASVESAKEMICIVCNNERYNVRYLLLCNGSDVMIPPIKGLSTIDYWTSKEALDNTTTPQSLAIIGGGVIGMEFASFFNSMGVKVHVIEMMPEILGAMDKETSAMLRTEYTKKGISFYLNTKVTEVSKTGITIEQQGKANTLEADKILVCVGRKAVLNMPGLEKLNIELRSNGVNVNEYMQTSNPNVYACGDITGFSMLAHTAMRESDVAINHILGIKDRMSYDAIPAVVYTNPEIAGIGKTEEELIAGNVRYSVLKLPMAYSGRFVAENEAGNGLCKLIINEQEQIIGCHLMGNPVSELIVVAGIALERKFTVDEFKQIVFPHPTVGEIIHESLFL